MNKTVAHYRFHYHFAVLKRHFQGRGTAFQNGEEERRSLFKQIKQNFPLRYFYSESAHAIKTQIWVTLIANLLLSFLQSKLKRRWSFSGLATIVRIVLMYYLNLEKFLNQPDADLNIMLAEASEPPPQEHEID